MLGNCFREKINNLQGFLAITKSLEEALDRGDMAEASMLLQKRQDIVAVINNIDGQLKNISGHKTEAIKKINDFNIDILNSIVAINDRCVKKIAAAKKDFGGQISSVQKQKAGVNCYRKVARGVCESRFVTSEH